MRSDSPATPDNSPADSASADPKTAAAATAPQPSSAADAAKPATAGKPHAAADEKPRPAPALKPPPPATSRPGQWLVPALLITILVALCALAGNFMLWQKLNDVETRLARSAANSAESAIEARTTARTAQEQVQNVLTQQGVLASRLDELTAQRAQLEAVLRNYSRSQDDTLAVDIESSLRLAMQQTRLGGNLEPLVAALKSARQRIARSPRPELVALAAAIDRDLQRVQQASVTDPATLLAQLDDLLRLVDRLPSLADASAAAPPADAHAPTGAPSGGDWRDRLAHAGALVWSEIKPLLQVSRVDLPEAALLAPEQRFFVREKLRIQLLNARLGILARQFTAVRNDLETSSWLLQRYFNPDDDLTRRAQDTLNLLGQQAHEAQLPQLDDTFAALAAIESPGHEAAESPPAAEPPPPPAAPEPAAQESDDVQDDQNSQDSDPGAQSQPTI